MTRWHLSHWWNRDAGSISPRPIPDVSEALPPQLVWYLLDVWLAQASSLRILGLRDLMERKLRMAADVAIRSTSAHPKSPIAWINLARVRIEAEHFDKAKEALGRGRQLVGETADSDASTMLGHLEGVVLQRTANPGGIAAIFHVCQMCGHLISYIGRHCPHCGFAPASKEDVRRSSVLSRLFMEVPSLLNVAVSIQLHKATSDIYGPSGTRHFLDQVSEDECRSVLDKLKQKAADDHLSFSTIEKCSKCGTRVWESWADKCPKCGEASHRPSLARFIVCVERVLHHFVFFVRRSDERVFSDVVTQLVWMKWSGLSEQVGPTDELRAAVVNGLRELSPLYAQNGAGVVRIGKAQETYGEVIRQTEDGGIVGTVEDFSKHLRQLLKYLDDEICLF